MPSASNAPPATATPAIDLLRRLTGNKKAEFRDGQLEAITQIVERRGRVLCVQRTGWGKSAVYFVATAMLREQGAGPTILVSPLIALMRNQLEAAEALGIHAASVNSSNREDWQETFEQIDAGEVDLLLLSPERLANPHFRRNVLPELIRTSGLLVIDEAHCISDWGHDFRPDYRRIRTLLGDLPDGVPVLATTATANARVTADVAEQLGDDVLVLRGSLDRESLRLGVVRLKTAEQRLAWLADHLAEQPGSGIVYCLTVAATQEVAGYLRSRGHDVHAYSGQTDTTERSALEADLAAGRVKALVATSALGMGFDATLGFVVNLGAPQSPVAYYQQVGRAGRGTDDATVVLLPATEDRDIWAYFASLAFPREELVRQTLDVLAAEGRPMSTAAIETRVELSRTRLETMLKVLDVDGAVRRVGGGWVSTGEAWAYDAERYARVREAREREQQAMLDYIATDDCRMHYLRAQLDDPEAARCGRCDNCGGLTLSTSLSEAAVDAASERLARPGVPVAPRKMWPTGLAALGLDVKGRIAEGAEEGRAVARLTDLGHGAALRALFRADADDGPVPLPLVKAVIDVLDDWRPRVSAIVAVESATRPTLVGDLVAGLSRYLQVPVVGSYAIVDPSIGPGRGQANSAQRVGAVSRRYAWRPAADAPPDVLDGAEVLLVDDQCVTGWTLTLAARDLRATSAAAIHPLVLATTG
jgi:ATP-dependent DNA helicase RecQ